jgi:hypothetical protein
MIKLSTSQLPGLKLTLPSMDKVDRLGWSSGFTLRSYGVDIGIRSNDAETLERVVEHLPPYWESTTLPKVDRVYSILHRNGTGAGSRRLSLLYSDDRRLTRSEDLADIFTALESDLRLFVAEFAKERVFVHAGVVGWKGQAIIIPGRSYSGKSTLVAELVRAGATYYSDEYAVLDARGRVHPYTKPIELRPEGTYVQSKFDVSELGGRPGKKSLPVALVLITGYKTGASWRPRKLTAGKGVLEILFNTVSARRDPAGAFGALRQVAAQADILKGVRGDAVDTVPAILRRLERRLAK